MLTIFADAIRRATLTDRWDAPAHWQRDDAPRGRDPYDDESHEWRRRAMRDVGMR